MGSCGPIGFIVPYGPIWLHWLQWTQQENGPKGGCARWAPCAHGPGAWRIGKLRSHTAQLTWATSICSTILFCKISGAAKAYNHMKREVLNKHDDADHTNQMILHGLRTPCNWVTYNVLWSCLYMLNCITLDVTSLSFKHSCVANLELCSTLIQLRTTLVSPGYYLGREGVPGGGVMH